jgi:large subunit ribosomal protein L15
MELYNLEIPQGAKKKPKRVGRGPGSGHGKTSCKGHNGQRSRRGHSLLRGFEGGQMPLHRRLPKRGFVNIFKKEYAIINIDTLAFFKSGDIVNPEILLNRGLIKKIDEGIKVLGRGELKIALTVYAHQFSNSARSKIEAAGGKVEVLPSH